MDWQELVKEYSGFTVSQEDVDKYMPEAKRKLDGIIEREGDPDGTRVEVCYLAALLGEIIAVEKFSEYCMMIK